MLKAKKIKRTRIGTRKVKTFYLYKSINDTWQLIGFYCVDRRISNKNILSFVLGGYHDSKQ